MLELASNNEFFRAPYDFGILHLMYMKRELGIEY